MALSAGQTLSFYEILGPLGAGGMGQVWRARDTRLGRDVAIKVLPDDLRGDPERRTRFLREARAVAQLSHPHIAQIHDVGETEGHDYIALELVEGRTLADVLAHRPLPLADLVELALPLADALAYAHERGIVHRDLKAANVMVTSRGHAKLLDFGLAKVLLEGKDERRAKTTTLTMQGAIFGTPAAMSPEQALGKTLDARSDVFSFGSLLFEMASGRPAFQGGTVMEVMNAVIHDDPPPLGRIQPELPQDFVAIVEKALRKDPRERYQTMSDLAADLRHFKRTTDSGLVPPGREARRSSRLALAGALAVVLLAAGGWWFTRPASPDTGSAHVPSAKAPAPLVAVMGFENLADPTDADALGRMLTSLIATDLAEHGGLRVVSTAKVLASLEAVKQGGGSRFESALASRAAQATGASVMLVGQILRSGESVLLTAELVDVASGETRGSLREQAGSAEGVFALAGGLAGSVRRTLGVVEASKGFDLSRSLTDSPEAYKEFNTGELAMHRRDFDLARTHFERAVATDPTFAMAWFRLGLAHDWLDTSGAAACYDKALEHAGRLSDRWRVICMASAARARGDDDTAFSALEPLIEAGMDIPEAYNVFGEILTHSFRYRDPERARRCFARALELDPTFELVLYHLIEYILAAGDIDEAKALVARIEASGHTPYGELAILLEERRFTEVVARAEADLSAGRQTDFESYVYAARYLGDEQVFSRAITVWTAASPGQLRWRENHLALDDFAHGRFGSAVDHVDRAIESSSEPFARSVNELLRTYLAYFMGDDEAAVVSARRTLERDPYQFDSWFWLGFTHLRAGRPAEAAQALSEGRAALERSRSTVAPAILDALEAMLLSSQGEHARAKGILERARSRPPLRRQKEIEALVTARVAEATGDLEGAIAAWHEVVEPFYQHNNFELPTWPLYELGLLEQERGELEPARKHLTRFLELWGDADRPLPSIADARARLARLEGR